MWGTGAFFEAALALGGAVPHGRCGVRRACTADEGNSATMRRHMVGTDGCVFSFSDGDLRAVCRLAGWRTAEHNGRMPMRPGQRALLDPRPDPTPHYRLPIPVAMPWGAPAHGGMVRDVLVRRFWVWLCVPGPHRCFPRLSGATPARAATRTIPIPRFLVPVGEAARSAPGAATRPCTPDPLLYTRAGPTRASRPAAACECIALHKGLPGMRRLMAVTCALIQGNTRPHTFTAAAAVL